MGDSTQRLSFILLATLWIPCWVGCAQSTEAPQVTEDTRLELISSQKVYLTRPGRGITDKHVGFVEEKLRVVDGEDTSDRIYMAYDINYRTQVGYYLDNGATYKIGPDGEHTNLGNYDLQKTLRYLYGAEGTYRLAPTRR